MNKILIDRYSDSGKQTIGVGYVIDENGYIKKEFHTLELSWKENKRSISCIPTGTYKIKKRTTKKFGNHFILLDVPNRSYILIHKGNYYTDIRGCILVGSDLTDLNKDGEIDVINSTKTVKEIYELLPDESEIIIK